MTRDSERLADRSSQYIDAREFSKEHTTITCMECGRDLWAHWSFAMHRDEWYCEACLPEDLKDIGSGHRVEVRI